MRHAVWIIAGLLLATSPVVGVRTAQAEPTAEEEERGRVLATEAMTAYNAEDYAAALEKFSEAATVYPTGQVLRMRGYTLMALKRWLEAQKQIEKALETEFKPLVPRDAEHAEDQLNELKKHISKVELVSSVEGTAVVIDGGEPQALPVTLRLGEGKYTALVSAEGYEDVETVLDIKGGQEQTIALDPKSIGADLPPPKTVPKPEVEPTEPEDDEPTNLFGGWFPEQRTVGVVVAGAGIAVAGVAIGAGVYGATLRSAVSDNVDAHNLAYGFNCSQGNGQLCRYDIALINRDGARAQDFQTAALVAGIVSAGLIAVGGTFYLLAPDGPLAPDQSGPDKGSLQCGPELAGALPLGGSLGVGCLGSF